MMTRLLTLLAAAALATAQSPFPSPYPPTNEIEIDNMTAVPMRDGVKLYADVYRPAKAGRYPVIVCRTPYSTERFPSAYQAGVFFSRRGYVFVFQDTRGRFESEGKWEPFRDDIEDGYDTIEWAAKQPWSNGKVGMQGGSYLGHVQWRAAMAKPPSLVTIFPNVASTSLYHDWITLNGGWRLAFNFGWGAVRMESRVMQNTGPNTITDGPRGQHFDTLQWHLPLTEMPKRAGRGPQFYQDWLKHPDYDAYWKKINVEEMFDQIGIPVHTAGGWFDIFSQGTLRGYAGVSAKGATADARKLSRMVIGPWGHGPSRKYGELDFGEHANMNGLAVQLAWFDRRLKGIDNGLDNQPPVTMFVMGKNVWRREREYPLARTQYRKMYLSGGGRANTAAGDGRLSWDAPTADSKPDKYRYDPDNPVPSHGGNNCCGAPTVAGPVDQTPIEARGDVLVYTSQFLEDEVEIAGPVKLVLHASSDAPDTDFVAKLIDVYPDGRSFNMAEGIVRARYREGLDRPKLLTPGQVYEFEIDMVGTAVAFQKGHRIRVDITSSHFPQFDRNPNTGEPFGTTANVRVANQTIHHTPQRPSHLVLPVIPK
ncbi:MAG: CocE/NonD family hydrolase [Bryobacterales bacterium]|nr:CocE/NonD family hydrolase [Bryobacterales bacterium]